MGRWNSAKVGVIARTSARAYRGSSKSIAEIGRELGVHYIVEGSARRNKEHYRITVMLIRAKDQAHLWAANYTRTLDDVTALQIEVARTAIREIGRRIGVEPDEVYLIRHRRSRETPSLAEESTDAMATTEAGPSVPVPLADAD